MNGNDQIALSFFPVERQTFEFGVYRRPYKHGETSQDFPDCRRQNLPLLPLSSGESQFESYWITFDNKEGFTPYHCKSHTNNYLTLDYLFNLLQDACQKNLSQEDYRVGKHFRDRWIAFVIDRFSKGEQIVSLEPYLLRSTRQFGFLTDFRFHARPNIKFSRKIQELSLSIDKEGRSNRNFYIDRYERIECFVKKYGNHIFDLSNDIRVKTSFSNLQARKLETRRYIFGNDQEDNSQFTGIKRHGPLSTIDSDVKIYFLYRENDRPFSHDLFRALRGDTFSFNFPGMERMFKYRFDGSNVGGTEISDFSQANIETVISVMQQADGNRPIVPLIVVPFDKHGENSGNSDYFMAKHTFLKHRIPCQFVTLKLLQQKNQFKWAVSNIGLALFAKMGGQPWKVKPKTENCLIIGIGQSHHKKSEGGIDKYFAYSVLTESTGLYKELRILGQTTDKGTYFDSFRNNLKLVIQQYYDQYDSFVVHTTFSIRRDELEAVKEVMQSLRAENEVNKKPFILMKFNHKNKFFGYATANNSMIPFESSYLQLSQTEYLIWFEGLQYHNPNVYKRIERPVHIEFIYESDKLQDEHRIAYLQDALNISGANWRGFNAKSLPISIFYAHLVAEYYKQFQVLGLQDIDFETFSPWFL